MSQFVIITGLSGAGRSTAADIFEDMGWFVIDNLPPALIPKVVELSAGPSNDVDRVALAIGAGPYLAELAPALERLRVTEGDVRILFLEAADDVLIRRYEDKRRRHPLDVVAGMAEKVGQERALLEPVKALADVVLDTSELNEHQLRDRIAALFSGDDPSAMQTAVVSFGYKHGIPLDVDVVMDCRFLPNPHWVEDLRPLTGLEGPVRDYVLAQPETKAFLDRLDSMFELVLPGFVKEGKSYLTVAVGCTGGRHRSVVLAEEVADLMRERGFHPTVHHRDVNR